MEPHRVVIIGGGPTAIGAALRIRELIDEGRINAEVTILEAASRVGGLASSVTTARGFTYDLGVHIMGASKFPDFEKITTDAVRGEWNFIKRDVQVYMRHLFPTREIRHCYIPYPVQNSIANLPDDIRDKCEQELEELTTRPSSSHQNFEQFAKSTFGETLTDVFFRPYNQKIWTVSIASIGSSWVEGRVPRPNPKTLKGKKTNSERFHYPAKLRGVGLMWDRIVLNLPQEWIHLNSTVTNVDTGREQVILADDRRFSYDSVISTIPIDQLGRITGLAQDLPLQKSKVVLCGIGMTRPQPEHTESYSWLYFPQPDIIFYRVTFISNFNECMTPNVALYWSVLCEIGVSSEAEVDEADVAERSVQDLLRVGIITDQSLVVERWVKVQPYGYPIPSINRDETLARAHSSLEKHKIYSRGRFGSWLYETSNQDHSFNMGKEVVDEIFTQEKQTPHLQ